MKNHLSFKRLLVLVFLMSCICGIFGTTSAYAKGNITIKDYRIDNFGKTFKVKIRNNTWRPIIITGKTTFAGNMDTLVSGTGYYNYYKYSRRWRYTGYSRIEYKTKKKTTIPPYRTKWVKYKRVAGGSHLFYDNARYDLKVCYRFKGSRAVNTESDWFYQENYW